MLYRELCALRRHACAKLQRGAVVMKWAIVVVAAVAAFSAAPAGAQSTTVYYQPTPIPDAILANPANSQMKFHIYDGWFGSVYNTSMIRDDKLQVGGWGDTYMSLLRFELTALPKSATNAVLWLYAIPSGASNPSQVSLWPIHSAAPLFWGEYNRLSGVTGGSLSLSRHGGTAIGCREPDLLLRPSGSLL
jgi:hypothetical protein